MGLRHFQGDDVVWESWSVPIIFAYIFFEKKYGWQYATMYLIFDVKQQEIWQKASLVVGGHVLNSTEYIIYSYIITNVSVLLILLIAVNNGLFEEWARTHGWRYWKLIIYGPLCWKYLVLIRCGVWSYTWFINGTKSDLTWIKYGIKLIPKIFLWLSQGPRIYTI